MSIGISCTILPETQDEAVKAMEALTRVATGLAFEGISVSLSINSYEPDLDD
jgi:hypothetical protein